MVSKTRLAIENVATQCSLDMTHHKLKELYGQVEEDKMLRL